MRNVLLLHQDVIEILVSAALVLHNFLRESDAYCPTGLLDTESVTGEVLTGWWCQDLSFSAGDLGILVSISLPNYFYTQKVP